MTDEQFAMRLVELDAQGKDGVPEMRELLKANGGMGRVIALALRGVTRAKRDRAKVLESALAPDFPDKTARDNAIVYWKKNGRADLEMTIEHEIDKFRHHYAAKKCESWPRRWGTWYRNAIDMTHAPRSSLFPSAIVAFEQTSIAGWTNRLRVFQGLDEDCPAGTWSPKWGPKPGDPGCRVPAEASAPGQSAGNLARK